MRIGAVILAGGYGTCRSVGGSPFPKVVERIGGAPMICRVANLVSQDTFSSRVIVVNPIYDELIREALEGAGLNNCSFVLQPRRNGAGEAVRLALPHLIDEGIDDFLVVYADMPLWRPETVTGLVQTHRTQRPVLSMVTVQRAWEYPMLNHYGRVLRNGTSEIIGIVEPADADRNQLEIQIVNPSLWMWNLDWFANHIEQVPFYPSKDGLGKERFLPPLVKIARREGCSILEHRLADAQEALGVNTLEDLELVRTCFT